MMDHAAAGHEVGGGKTKRILIDNNRHYANKEALMAYLQAQF